MSKDPKKKLSVRMLCKTKTQRAKTKKADAEMIARIRAIKERGSDN